VNFLAHALLAGDTPALVVGGVVGDWIKGPLPGSLPADLARGVALHRAIDSHAETHPAFRQSRARMSAARRRYAGVLVDVFYDHLLASAWDDLHPRPFAEYRAGVYRQVAGRLAELPPHSHFALELMAEQDWFLSYAHVEGIADVLARMSRRARRPNPLAGGEAELLADAAGFRADFQTWLVDARVFAQEWQSESRG
jgi:acyl carrier protein phosphodiesterase